MAATNVVSPRIRTRMLSESALLIGTLAGFVVWQLGANIDAWYHAHYGFAIESFLTWPHALLYFGWVASAAPAALYLFESNALATPRASALPPGYPLVIGGAIVFGIGGALDLAWHESFGFEVGHEALVSPSHLVLIYGSALGTLGLVWAAIDRRRRAAHGARVAGDLAVVLGLGILLSALLFGFGYSQPFSTDYASSGALSSGLYGYEGIRAWGDMVAQIAGTTGMVFHAMLLALFTAVPLRLLRLPTGALATIVLWSAAMTLVAGPEMWIYLPAAVAGALVGEGVWAAMGRGALGGRDGRAGYWTIAFVVPATQLFAYFALMAGFGGGITWSTPLWSGAPVLAGLYGLIACMFAIPPAFVHGENAASR
jgi:hypothetical protein